MKQVQLKVSSDRRLINNKYGSQHLGKRSTLILGSGKQQTKINQRMMVRAERVNFLRS